MKLLGKFQADFQVKAEVKEFLLQHLKNQAVTKAFNGEDTTGIKEAKECIERAFRDLDKVYGERKVRKATSSR